MATSASYTENGAAVTLSPALTVTRPGQPDPASARRCRSPAAPSRATATCWRPTTTGTSITASYNAATETLTLTGTDTLAHYQQVLDSVDVRSTSDNPTDFGSDPTRTVTWVVNDGTARTT